MGKATVMVAAMMATKTSAARPAVELAASGMVAGAVVVVVAGAVVVVAAGAADQAVIIITKWTS